MSFPTSWNNYTTDCGARPTPLGSRGGDVYLVVHHAVNRRVQDTIALSKPGGRLVSMSFAIGPTVAGVTSPVYCVGVVPEDKWPWTTGAPALDRAALTAEVSNIDLTADYPVAQDAKEWLAQIAAYMAREFGMPLDRVHILSHQEAYARGWGSYPTACPGPDLQGTMDWIVDRAKQINTTNKRKKPPMSDAYLKASTLQGGKRVATTLLALAGGGGANWLEMTNDHPEGNANETAVQLFNMRGAGAMVVSDARWDAIKKAYTTIPPLGSVSVESDPELLAAQVATTDAVKALAPKIDATTAAVKAPRTTTPI